MQSLRTSIRPAVWTLAAGCFLAPGVATSQPGTVLSYQKISNTAGGLSALIDNLDEFGGAVGGLGDLDGAGSSVTAVAVGAIGDDDGGTNKGAVYILFLNSALTVQSFQKISDTQGNFTAPFIAGDEFGSAVAGLGDLDGVGGSAGALAVGVAFADDGGTNRGAVFILYVNSAGSVVSFQKISDTQGNFTPVIDNADEFGGALAFLGDLDGPGGSATALAVAAVGDDDGGADRGAVYILFLNTNGTVASHQKISDLEGGFTAPLANAAQFGSSVTYLGDLDGAGPSTGAIAVGSVGDTDGGTNRGAVYILFLNSAGSVLSYQKISDTQGGFTGVLDNEDEFGGAVQGLGDIDRVNPSVASALAVGAIGDDDGGLDRGAVWVLFLNSAGTVVSHQKISNTSGNFTGVMDDGDEFSGSLGALGDMDGNGDAEQVVISGTPGDDDGGGGRGAIYFLSIDGLRTSGTETAPLARSGLGRATPNPFNPRTTIPFRIATPGQARIEIWDATGSLVRTLVDARFAAGEHRTSWDGLDNAGRPMASGTYFYGLVIDGRSVGRAEKAILLK